jgi:hypothetical protein
VRDFVQSHKFEELARYLITAKPQLLSLPNGSVYTDPLPHTLLYCEANIDGFAGSHVPKRV